MKLTGELELNHARNKHTNLNMWLFNLKLEALTTGKAAPPKSRNVQHFHVQVPRTHPIPETCSMGVSESRVLGAAAALHDIQQEAKTGQHALEKLNVFSSFCLRGSGKEQGREVAESTDGTRH